MRQLDRARFDWELARRNLTAARLAELSGLSRTMISFARNGRPMAPATFARISEAIMSQPVVPGADRLLRVPDR